MPDLRQVGPKAFDAALREREEVHGAKRMLVMDMLEGNELSIDVLCIEGTAHAWMIREKTGDTTQIVHSDHPVMDYVHRLVADLQLHGIVGVQFKYSRDDNGGQIKFLEINVRPSGGCVAYGDEAMRVVGRPSLVAIWFAYMAGRIQSHDIVQWQGKVKLNLRTEARAQRLD